MFVLAQFGMNRGEVGQRPCRLIGGLFRLREQRAFQSRFIPAFRQRLG
jgi:hypothetical protein